MEINIMRGKVKKLLTKMINKKRHFTIGVFIVGICTIGIVSVSMLQKDEIRMQIARKVLELKFPQAATLIGPHSVVFSFEMGNYYFGNGSYDIDKAQKHYLDALTYNEPVFGLHYQLGRTYFIQGRFSEAITEINTEMKLFPENKRTYYIRGLIYGYMKEYESAAQDFRAFLESQPENWAGWNDLSWIYFQMGEYALSANAAQHGLEYGQTSPWLHNALGVALLNIGNLDGAKISLEQALFFAEKMQPEDWGVAYPGNNPEIYGEGLERMKESIQKNLVRIEEMKKKN